ncbi:MAG: hypothetical protein ABI450_02465 [Rhizomicrobium sp.]
MSILITLAGCDEYWLDTYWHDGSYRLIAIDTRGQMALVVDGSMEAILGPTIFSIGADERHLVIKQHPSKDAFGGFDRSITRFYVVDRKGQRPTIQGPFSEEEFKKLSLSEPLPPFAKTFKDLE